MVAVSNLKDNGEQIKEGVYTLLDIQNILVNKMDLDKNQKKDLMIVAFCLAILAGMIARVI